MPGSGECDVLSVLIDALWRDDDPGGDPDRSRVLNLPLASLSFTGGPLPIIVRVGCAPSVRQH